jgi:hypothetical protein
MTTSPNSICWRKSCENTDIPLGIEADLLGAEVLVHFIHMQMHGSELVKYCVAGFAVALRTITSWKNVGAEYGISCQIHRLHRANRYKKRDHSRRIGLCNRIHAT